MWTAIILGMQWSPGCRRLRRVGRACGGARRAAVAFRRRHSRRVSGGPAAVDDLLVHARVVVPRRAAGRHPPHAAGAHRNVRRRIRGACALHTADDLLPVADARTSARARRAADPAAARRRLQRGRVERLSAASRGARRSGRSTRCRMGRRSRRSNTSRTSSRHGSATSRPRPARRRSCWSGTAWAGSSRAPTCAITAAPRCAGWSPSARRTTAACTRG